MNSNSDTAFRADWIEGENTIEIGRMQPLAKWGIAIVLLMCEISVLKWRYSILGLLGNDSLWVRLVYYSAYAVGYAREFLPSMGVAVLVFGGKVFWDHLRNRGRECRSWAEIFIYLFGHLLLFGSFFKLTGFVIEGGPHFSRYPAAWVALWTVAGAATFVSLALSVYSAAVWLELIRGCRKGLISGMAISGAAWISERGIEQLWAPLAKYTFRSVGWLLLPLFPDFFSDPATLTIGNKDFSVFVGAPCSGFQGMGMISVLLAAGLLYFREELRFPQVFLLFPIGIAAMWLTNTIRIAILLILGIYVSGDVAEQGFHSQAGWLALNVVALGLIACAGRMRFFTKIESRQREPLRDSRTTAYLMPILAVLAAAMVTGMFSAGFDWLYPLRVIVVLGVLWFFRKSYENVRLSWSWNAVLTGACASVMWGMLAHSTRTAQAVVAGGIADLPARWAVIWILFRIAGYIVAVPIAEELAFRGYLLRRLVATEFMEVRPRQLTMFAVVLSSMLFGAMHGRNWLPGILAGMLYTWAFYRRGRLGDAIMAHATTNGLISIYVLATGDWSKMS